MFVLTCYNTVATQYFTSSGVLMYLSALPSLNTTKGEINMEKKQINTAKLRKLIKDFKFNSKPSDAIQSNPCTIRDINEVIDNVSKLLNKFVDELEEFDE